MKLSSSSVFLAALVAVGAITFFIAAARRERVAAPFPYSLAVGGEKEGEFDLFIGS